MDASRRQIRYIAAMNAAPRPTPYEARIAIARRLAGGLPTAELDPFDAAALWQAGLLDERDIGQLAAIWIERGLDQCSPNLAAIALDPPASMADAAQPFAAALAEMGITIPAEEDGERTALALYLQAMIEGRLPKMVAMNAIDQLWRAEPAARVCHPNRRDDDPTRYLGEVLGVEYLLGPYYQLLDLAAGAETPPPGETLESHIAALEGKLMEEARTLHRHLGAGGNA